MKSKQKLQSLDLLNVLFRVTYDKTEFQSTER